MGPRRINTLLRRIMEPRLSPGKYAAAKYGLGSDTDRYPWGRGMGLVGRISLEYHIRKTIPSFEIRPAIIKLIHRATKTPIGMGSLSGNMPFPWAAPPSRRERPYALRKCAKCRVGYSADVAAKRFRCEPRVIPRKERDGTSNQSALPRREERLSF